MAGAAAAVPKFGSWDAENIGYTVFFEKVRDNKGPPPPAAAPNKAAPGSYDFDPYEHYENLSRKVPSRPPSSHGHGSGGHTAPKAPGGGGYYLDPYEQYDNLSGSMNDVPSRPPSSHGHGPAAGPKGYGGGHGDLDDPYYEHYENMMSSGRNVPSSRPPSSHGHHAPAPPHHRGGSNGYHRRTGSNGSSAASDTSRFSPPKPYQYQPRYGGNNHHHQAQHQQGADAARGQYHPQGARAPSGYRAYASPSPPRGPPPPLRRPKASSAVPRFGVWDEQNAAMAAQGFTVQFDKVKRHREEAKAAAAPPVPPQRVSPDRYAPAPAQSYGKKRKDNKSFLSKVYRCMFPVVRE